MEVWNEWMFPSPLPHTGLPAGPTLSRRWGEQGVIKVEGGEERQAAGEMGEVFMTMQACIVSLISEMYLLCTHWGSLNSTNRNI